MNLTDQPLNIPDLLARGTAIRNAVEGLPDDLRDDPLHGAWKIEIAVLAAPAADVADLELKLRLWGALIEDPPSILDEHVGLWAVLREDLRRLVSA